ncbi:hypothetical protein GOV07_05815 [Candidatus Woesearchaeota archaeon]|nr:hypothetical protein [Candidatus Woesearchaeota archaeon]
MGCYTVPTAAFIVHKVLQRKNKNLQNLHHNRLSLLLLGGTLFGVVDHAWNGELLFGKEGLVLDLLLGVTITVSIFIVWGVMGVVEKWRASTGVKQ